MKQQLTIVKVGGAVVEDPAQLDCLLTGFCRLGGRKALVHGGGRRAPFGRALKRRLDDRLGDKGPGRVVDGDQLAGRRLHPSAGAFGPGIPARHQPDRLLAAGGLPPGQHRVLPRHQDDLPDQRAAVKGPQAAAQHRPVPQVIPKFIKAHPGGRACRQNHGRSCLFHLSVLVCPAYAKARYIL